MSQPWSVQTAKAKLSRLLALARAGEPQVIGMENGQIHLRDFHDRIWIVDVGTARIHAMAAPVAINIRSRLMSAAM